MNDSISIIDAMRRWEQELAAEVMSKPKADALARIAAIKRDIRDIIDRHQLTAPPLDIPLHSDSTGISAGPYCNWRGKVKFAHPERIRTVRAWLLFNGAYTFALLSDGDIAECIFNVPILRSRHTMEYFQVIDLRNFLYSSSQLKIVEVALKHRLELMQRFDKS